jgi:hypothetical protein
LPSGPRVPTGPGAEAAAAGSGEIAVVVAAPGATGETGIAPAIMSRT